MRKKSNKRAPAKRRSAAGSPAKRKAGGSKVRNTIIVLVVTLVAAVAIAAVVGIWKLNSGSADNGSRKFPSFVYAASTPPKTPKAYQAAVDFYDDFSKIPCFCGCGQHNGHTSLQSCFISARNGDDFVFGDHGAG